jgi:hypothetical protein
MGGSGGRRLGLGLTLLVVTTAVVACGGKSEQAQAQELILGAAQATYAAGTAQVSLSLVGLGDGEGEGQVDFANAQSETTIDLPTGPATVYVDGTDVLIQVDDATTVLDPAALDPLGQLRLLLLFLSPGQVVQLLNGLDGDVDIVGDEPVDGVDATHYRLTVSLDALLDSLDGDARAVMADLLAALDLGTLDVDVWLDDDGRVVQFQTVLDVDGEEVTVTIGYTDFGSDVDIRIPEAGSALTSDEFGLATADISGGWTAQSQIVSTTVPGWVDVGAAGPEVPLDLRCRPNGSCVNRENGTRFDPAGPGMWTNSSDVSGPCGATPGGYHQTSDYTWTVTADEDGVATEMTLAGTINGEVTPSGLAGGCRLGVGLVGPTTGTATVEGTATRN